MNKEEIKNKIIKTIAGLDNPAFNDIEGGISPDSELVCCSICFADIYDSILKAFNRPTHLAGKNPCEVNALVDEIHTFASNATIGESIDFFVERIIEGEVA